MLISDRAKIISNIRIILVSPQIPENIGLCARVLKNTGNFPLILVNPNLTSKSWEVAKKARDVLEKAEVVNNLRETLGKVSSVFGTTRRRREFRFIYSFPTLLPFIVGLARKNPIAIIFGKEDVGLSKEEMSWCNSIFSIPANPRFPSYNLAFACGIVCYRIREYLESVTTLSTLTLAHREEIDSLFHIIQRLLEKRKFKKKRLSSMIDTLRRLALRSPLTHNEVQLLKALLMKVNIK